MVMKQIVFFIFSLLILIFWASCKHDPLEPFDPNGAINPGDTIPLPPDFISDCDPDSVYFLNQIVPLLEISCGSSVISCHDGPNSTSEISFNTYEDLFINIEDDPNKSPKYLIVPGNISQSEMIEAINETDTEDKMPPDTSDYSISASGEQMLEDWINQGALNNGCNEGCDSTDVSFQNDIFPIIYNYCTGCHSGPDPSGGLVLTDYDGIITA